jgi:hypothetical protein
MDHLAIAATGPGAKFTFGFEQQHLMPFQGKGAGHSNADNPGTDHDGVRFSGHDKRYLKRFIFTL